MFSKIGQSVHTLRCSNYFNYKPLSKNISTNWTTHYVKLQTKQIQEGDNFSRIQGKETKNLRIDGEWYWSKDWIKWIVFFIKPLELLIACQDAVSSWTSFLRFLMNISNWWTRRVTSFCSCRWAWSQSKRRIFLYSFAIGVLIGQWAKEDPTKYQQRIWQSC